MARKRKGFYLSLFQWHLAVFIAFALLVAYSLVATITYPGNAEIPFGVFRPVIIERLLLILIVGTTLLAHFTIQQFRVFLQSRRSWDCQSSTDYMPDTGDGYLWLETQDNNSELLDDDLRTDKRKRH